MNYYRLEIERPFLKEREIDFRYRRSVSVGDDPSNDICIDSIALPSQFKMLRRPLGLNQQSLRLKLTDETVESLTGEFEKKKEWKSRLYKGSEFEVRGPCTWAVGDVQFRLIRADESTLPPLTEIHPEDSSKPWARALAYAGGFHVALFLLLFLFGVITNLLHLKDKDVADVQLTQITVAQAKDIFKKPIPVPVEEVDALAMKEPEAIEEAIEPNKQMKVTAKKKVAPRQQIAKGTLSPGKQGNTPPKKDLNKMGLLAIQTSAGTSQVSVEAASSSKVRNMKQKDVELKAVGMGSADYGIGTAGDDSDQKIARLGSLSGSTYRGGELGQVAESSGKGKGIGGRGPAIRLARKEIEIRGALDPAVIRQIIEERLSEIRYCYETALLKDDKISGKIATTWTIKADGSVAEINSSSDEIKATVLHPCVRAQIQKWKFPQPKGGGVVRVKYPFLFNPVGG